MTSKDIYSEQCNIQELGMGNVLVYDSRMIYRKGRGRREQLQQ